MHGEHNTPVQVGEGEAHNFPAGIAHRCSAYLRELDDSIQPRDAHVRSENQGTEHRAKAVAQIFNGVCELTRQHVSEAEPVVLFVDSRVKPAMVQGAVRPIEPCVVDQHAEEDVDAHLSECRQRFRAGFHATPREDGERKERDQRSQKQPRHKVVAERFLYQLRGRRADFWVRVHTPSLAQPAALEDNENQGHHDGGDL